MKTSQRHLQKQNVGIDLLWQIIKSSTIDDLWGIKGNVFVSITQNLSIFKIFEFSCEILRSS